MADETKSPYTFAKLNDTNYNAWAIRMKMMLMKEDCWDTIEMEEEEEDWDLLVDADRVTALRRKNMKAWNIIVLCVSDDQLNHVKDAQGGPQKSRC